MIHIAICDDDKQELARLTDLVNAYSKQHIQYHIRMTAFESAVELMAEIEKGSRYTIILLDIIMPNTNGIDVAREIRGYDSLVKIIFLTSSPEFAIESYGVGAFHYVLKPTPADKLTALFDKAITESSNTADDHFLVNAKSGLSKLYLHNIEFVEVIGRLLIYHLRHGQILEAKGKLGDLEKILLSHRQFIKPHRSYIINMDCIDTVTANSIQTHSHKPIPISRINYGDIKQAYLDYSFGRGKK